VSIGRLYRTSDNKLVSKVNYQLQDVSATNWWGELTLVDYMRINEREGYIIKLEDKRKGKCRLKKRVNRAVSGVPPRYIYHFTGTSPFK